MAAAKGEFLVSARTRQMVTADGQGHARGHKFELDVERHLQSLIFLHLSSALMPVPPSAMPPPIKPCVHFTLLS